MSTKALGKATVDLPTLFRSYKWSSKLYWSGDLGIVLGRIGLVLGARARESIVDLGMSTIDLPLAFRYWGTSGLYWRGLEVVLGDSAL